MVEGFVLCSRHAQLSRHDARVNDVVIAFVFSGTRTSLSFFLFLPLFFSFSECVFLSKEMAIYSQSLGYFFLAIRRMNVMQIVCTAFFLFCFYVVSLSSLCLSVSVCLSVSISVSLSLSLSAPLHERQWPK